MIRVIQFSFIVLMFCIYSDQIYSQDYIMDTSFISNYEFIENGYGGYRGGINQLHFNEDSTIYISGGFDDPDDNSGIGDLIRMNHDGSLDPTFYTASSLFGVRGFDVMDNYLYAISSLAVVKKSLLDGVTDIQFLDNIDSSDWGGSLTDMFVYENGDFLVGGYIVYHGLEPDERRTYLARIHANGFYDTSFHHDANLNVRGFIKYDENRLIISGKFDKYDGVPCPNVARIYNDGTLDTTFNSEVYGYFRPIYVQDDGKVILGGWIYSIATNEKTAMVRLNSDGSLDTTFNNFNNAIGLEWGETDPFYDEWSQIATICPTRHDKLLIGGVFTNYQGHFRGNIALTDLNGFIDTNAFRGTSFDTTGKGYVGSPDFGVFSIVAGSGDTYYCGGTYWGWNGMITEPIIRLKETYAGIEELVDFDNKLSVYPNPAKSIVYVDLDDLSTSNKTVLLISNLEGRIIKEIPIKRGTDECQISVGDLNQGIYIFTVNLGSDIPRTQKVVVLK